MANLSNADISPEKTQAHFIDEASGIEETDRLNTPPAWLGAAMVFAAFFAGGIAGAAVDHFLRSL